MGSVSLPAWNLRCLGVGGGCSSARAAACRCSVRAVLLLDCCCSSLAVCLSGVVVAPTRTACQARICDMRFLRCRRRPGGGAVRGHGCELGIASLIDRVLTTTRRDKARSRTRNSPTRAPPDGSSEAALSHSLHWSVVGRVDSLRRRRQQLVAGHCYGEGSRGGCSPAQAA